MYFDNRLTEDDMQRVHDICPNPPPALLMAGSFAALLEAIDTYTQETVHPVTSGIPPIRAKFCPCSKWSEKRRIEAGPRCESPPLGRIQRSLAIG